MSILDDPLAVMGNAIRDITDRYGIEDDEDCPTKEYADLVLALATAALNAHAEIVRRINEEE